MAQSIRASLFMSCLGLAAATLPAAAQGTPQQREACMGDALRLCSDFVPNIGKVKACMRAHQSSLSPRCASAFAVATSGSTRAARPASVAKHDARAAVRTAAVLHTGKHRRVLVAAASAPRHRYAGGLGMGGFNLGALGNLGGSGLGGLGGLNISPSQLRQAGHVIGLACASQYMPAEACGMTRQFMGYEE